MTIDDVQLGLKLTRQAGWNQTESDWLRFMNLEPTGCFVAELNGSSVGTITTCLFGQVAWIAMLLVDAGTRGRGVGTAMLKHSLNYLEGRKVKTVRLDATSAGQPIYEKLGFVPEYQLARFACRDLASPSGPRREGTAQSTQQRWVPVKTRRWRVDSRRVSSIQHRVKLRRRSLQV